MSNSVHRKFIPSCMINTHGSDKTISMRDIKNSNSKESHYCWHDDTDHLVSYYPKELTKIYNFPKISHKKHYTIGIISFGGRVDIDEIKTYWLQRGIKEKHMPNIVIVPISDGTNDPDISDPSNLHITAPISGDDYENMMNIETLGCVLPSCKTTIVFYQTPNTIDGYKAIFEYAINDAVNNPTVLAMSWGSAELYEDINLLKYMNNLFKQATQKGINICTCSGNYGAQQSDYTNPMTQNVIFPASSPFVIACGGTSLYSNNCKYDENTIEKVWSNGDNFDYGGGGGYSGFFYRPCYQKNVCGIEGIMRSIPDISLNADPTYGVKYLIGGEEIKLGGTSLSTQFIAGFLSLCRVCEFVNPKLYEIGKNHPKCFYDITCGSIGAYDAHKGYDQCTGWGSFNGKKLCKYLHEK